MTKAELENRLRDILAEGTTLTVHNEKFVLCSPQIYASGDSIQLAIFNYEHKRHLLLRACC